MARLSTFHKTWGAGIRPGQLFLAFVLALDISPLVGTVNEARMKEDIRLLERVQNGEQIFSTKEELAIIGGMLGTPGWETQKEL